MVMKRRLRPPPKYGRRGVTTAAAAAALLLIMLAGWLIDRRAGTADETTLVETLRDASDDPAGAVAAAVRANRMVFLSDIHASASTKRLAVQALERIIETGGLDVLVLEVGADQQPIIDQYLLSNPENASLLVTNERTIREPGPATRDYLEIYRTVWKLNQKLGADQRIYILAADLDGWPPARPLSPADLARRSAEREAHMEARIREVRERLPAARMLIFMTGFHALKNVEGLVQSSGAGTVRVAWLADRLAKQFPEEVYSFVVDAPAVGSGGDVTTFTGTKISSILHRNGLGRTLAARLGPEFNFVREPLLIQKSPGVSFELEPRDYGLGDVADGYIQLR